MPPNFMEMMHIWSTFRLMVAIPDRLWKMAAIVTKNICIFFFFNSSNIVKSQCCYQTIKEQCIYNSLSDHEWWPRLPSNMAVATSQTWKLVKKSKTIEKIPPTKFLAHLCELLPITWHPSVNFFKNLLLWNHRANLNQTWPESSLGGSL
jgi:hypothetical protein